MSIESSVSETIAATPSQVSISDLLAPGARKLRALRERLGGVADAATLPPRVNLANNESVFGPSPKVIATLREQAGGAAALCRYPSGQALRIELALALGVEFSMVALGNGSNELLQLIAAAFLSPDVEAICPRLSYSMFAMVGTISGASVKFPPARGWGYDLEAIEAAVTDRTRLIFIANPNNPTAATLSTAELTRFLDAVPSRVLVILDEAYRDYVCDDPAFPDGVQLLARYPNLIVTRTFSKAHGLAALRVGYAVAATDLISAIQSSGQPNNVNYVATVAAQAALSDRGHVVRTRAANRRALAHLNKELSGIGIHCEPSRTNFVLARLGPRGTEVIRHLAKRDIAIASLAVYGINDHARITVGTDEDVAKLVAGLQSCEHLLS
jgi:histidinol-phosphate aminotransferase